MIAIPISFYRTVTNDKRYPLICIHIIYFINYSHRHHVRLELFRISVNDLIVLFQYIMIQFRNSNTHLLLIQMFNENVQIL